MTLDANEMKYQQKLSIIKQLKERLEEKDTEELLAIWVENDKEKWREEAFQAIRELLRQRKVDLPTQRKVTAIKKSIHGQIKKKYIFTKAYLYGVALPFILIVLVKLLSNFPGQTSRIIITTLFVLSPIISSSICSRHINKNTALPYSHPLVLFFKLLLSKGIFLPPMFFVSGFLTATIIRSFFSQEYSGNEISVSISLYMLGIVGSFIGVIVVSKN